MCICPCFFIYLVQESLNDLDIVVLILSPVYFCLCVNRELPKEEGKMLCALRPRKKSFLALNRKGNKTIK